MFDERTIAFAGRITRGASSERRSPASARAFLGALVLLAGMTTPLAGQSGPLEARLQAARDVLLAALEEHSAWCLEHKALEQRALVLGKILEVDPDHEDARRILGHKERSGAWVVPTKPKKFRDRDESVIDEARDRFDRALATFAEHLLAELEDPSLSASDREALEDEILRFDPSNERIREARGETELEGEWVLRETTTALWRRREVRRFVSASLEAPVESSDDGLSEREQALGMRLHLAHTPAARVLATSGQEEAVRTARALAGASRAFEEFFGKQVSLPEGCTIYLLAGAVDKEAFLRGHPAVTPELYAELEKLDGSGIPGTGDWAFWVDDPDQRVDGIVRMALGWYMKEAFGITLDHGWAHEGFGLYLTAALVGTRLNWFVQTDGLDPRATFGDRNRLLDPATDWLLEALRLVEDQRTPDLVALFEKPAAGLTVEDLVYSNAVATFLFEAFPQATPELLAEVAGERPFPEVLEERLGIGLGVFEERLARWLTERRAMPDVFLTNLTNDELRELWSRVGDGEKREVIAALRAELAGLDTRQLALVRELVARAEPPGGGWPEPKETEYYEPEVHAPADPIPRYWLEEDDRKAVRLLDELAVPPDPGDVVSGVEYEWSTGRIVRVAAPDDPDAAFENALDGYPPDTGLALAVALRELDGGHQRKAFTAFSHAYTDRRGNVFPGITLYDVWQSGRVMEMPDVDALGVIHDLLNDYERWVAPVPGTKHDELYSTIGILFQAARSYREDREILAKCLFIGAPVVPEGGEAWLTHLHSLWAVADSDPSGVVAQFPAADWSPQLEAWSERCQEDPTLWRKGWLRQVAFKRDGEEVRNALLAALEGTGSLKDLSASGDEE